MSRWFRFYGDAMRNPKVIGLNDRDFRTWVGLLAVASENEGVIPPLETAKTMLGMRLDHLQAATARLVKAGLIDELAPSYEPASSGLGASYEAASDLLAPRYEPHNWAKFQYKSDTSTQRVTLHRKRKSAADETAPETEAETEGPLAKANGAEASKIDPEKVMFDSGVSLLRQAGKSEGQARSLLGKWKRDHGAEAVIAGLGAAQREGAIDPAAFIEGRWREERRRANDDEGFSIGGVRMNSPC